MIGPAGFMAAPRVREKSLLLSPEQIHDKAAKCRTKLGYTRKVYELYRDQDMSELFPICGKFNVTERAIRRVQKLCRLTGDYPTPWLIDEEISQIVNDEKNW